jgi:hypothetical protein
MTCVWDGLISALKLRFRPAELAEFVKEHNIPTKNVLWNGKPLTDKQYQEHIDRIKEIDVKVIHQGYDCSSFDPLLFLISELFETCIIHNYMKSQIIYYNIKHPNKQIIVHSNNRHFWH